MFLFPGLMAASWLVMVVINAVLAQALAVRLGWNRRPSPDLSELELPSWLWPAIGVGRAARAARRRRLRLSRALAADRAGGALRVPGSRGDPRARAPLVASRGWRWRRVYAAMVLLGWPILAVLLLGFVEDWAHVRQPFAVAPGGNAACR